MTSVAFWRWGRLAATLVLSAGLLVASSRPVAAQDPATPLFDGAVVHEIRLLINSRDWETLKATFETNQYYPADLEWGDNRASNVGIRSRGNGSRSGVKPGLRVDINRYSASQRFLGLKSFVLRNNTQDPSHLHERLSMELFRRLGLPAPREAHARLYVNNTFAGLYTVVEAIDKSFLDVRFGESDGYLYDYDYAPDDPPYYFEDRGAADFYVPRPFKPETHEDSPRADVIERLVRVINAPTAAAFRLAIDEVLDVSAFIKHVAVEVFIGEKDGVLGDWGMNNFYLYRPATAASAHPASLPADDDRGWLEHEAETMYAQIAPSVHADPYKPHSNEAFEEAARLLRVFARERSAAVAAEVARARRP